MAREPAVSLRRTQLSTPASSERMIESAARSDADEVMLDLEDSVAPDEKAAARATLVEGTSAADWDGKLLAFRMNGLDTGWWYEDLIEVVPAVGAGLDDVVVPKVTSASDVHTVENLLATVEANAGLEVGAIGVEPQIEDGHGLHNAYEIAHASERVSCLVFGPGDYSAAMGAPGLDIGQFPDYPGHYWHHALSECNAAAKSAGIPCTDGPYADIDDVDGFRESAERANALGYDGKWVIHPSQIEVGNEVFAPDPAVAERARAIVDAYEDAQADGRGAVSVDGQMVDEATHKMALEIVAQADAAGIR